MTKVSAAGRDFLSGWHGWHCLVERSVGTRGCWLNEAETVETRCVWLSLLRLGPHSHMPSVHRQESDNARMRAMFRTSRVFASECTDLDVNGIAGIELQLLCRWGSQFASCFPCQMGCRNCWLCRRRCRTITSSLSLVSWRKRCDRGCMLG